MRDNDLPHDRKAMTPFAMGGLTSLAEIAGADDDVLLRASKAFTPEQRARCRALASAAAAAQAAAQAATAERAAAAAVKQAAAAAPVPARGKVATPGAGSWFKRKATK